MDLTNRWDLERFQKEKKDFRKIFFYRVCGTGMGAAACLLREKGFQVEGADSRFYPPMGDYLRQSHIPLWEIGKFDPSMLKDFDLIVVGNVVGKNSADARLIEQVGVPYCSFPAALGALVLKEINVIGVAGTHGKTTTTYFASQVFEKLGKNPGHLVGGVLPDRPPARLGDGNYFFIESDEYDSAYFEKISKFRMYCLDHLILTSLEYDHADIFTSVEAIKDEFRAVIPGIKKNIIFSQDYPAIDQLAEEFQWSRKKNALAYGAQSKLGPYQIKTDQSGSSFSLRWKGKELEFKTNIVGAHNVLNLSAVILFALQEEISPHNIQQAIGDLTLACRRQEERGHFRGALVIDDFAHHPRAVDLTIDSVRAKYPTQKIIVVLEPNSATARSDIFQQDFVGALSKADQIILAKPERPTTAIGRKDLDLYRLADDLRQIGRPAEVVEQLEILKSKLAREAKTQTIFLILSNGTCLGLWESDFVQELQ